MVITLSDLIWQRTVSKSLSKAEIDMINLTMRSQEREGLVLSRRSCSSPCSSTFIFSFLVTFLVLVSGLSPTIWQSRKDEESEKGTVPSFWQPETRKSMNSSENTFPLPFCYMFGSLL